MGAPGPTLNEDQLLGKCIGLQKSMDRPRMTSQRASRDSAYALLGSICLIARCIIDLVNPNPGFSVRLFSRQPLFLWGGFVEKPEKKPPF